LLLLN
jgi:hypothetical protein